MIRFERPRGNEPCIPAQRLLCHGIARKVAFPLACCKCIAVRLRPPHEAPLYYVTLETCYES